MVSMLGTVSMVWVDTSYLGTWTLGVMSSVRTENEAAQNEPRPSNVAPFWALLDLQKRAKLMDSLLPILPNLGYLAMILGSFGGPGYSLLGILDHSGNSLGPKDSFEEATLTWKRNSPSPVSFCLWNGVRNSWVLISR